MNWVLDLHHIWSWGQLNYFGAKSVEVRIKLFCCSCFTIRWLIRSLWPASVKFLGRSPGLVTVCYFRKNLWPVGLVILRWVLFTNLIQGTFMSIENHSGLMSLQTIPRMWTQSSWRQKENALSCLFGQPSMDWQETKVHNTLWQRDLCVWKGQQYRKCYPWHVPLVKKGLGFPRGCSVRT